MSSSHWKFFLMQCNMVQELIKLVHRDHGCHMYHYFAIIYRGMAETKKNHHVLGYALMKQISSLYLKDSTSSIRNFSSKHFPQQNAKTVHISLCSNLPCCQKFRCHPGWNRVHQARLAYFRCFHVCFMSSFCG